MLILFTAVLPLAIVASMLSWFAIRAVRLYGEVRAVVCPENLEPVTVRIDARHAAATAFLGKVDYRLASCSRWPEKRQCDRACLSQVAGAARGCEARASLARARRRTNCTLCGITLERGAGAQKPVLMSPDRKTVTEWDAVPAEKLFSTLATHSQMCWTCYMSETYRSVGSNRSLPSGGAKPASLAAAS